MATHAGLYRAKASKREGNTVVAFVPQVFGESPITIRDFVGDIPDTSQMGWVGFQGGNCEFPVWMSTGAQGEQGAPGTPGVSGNLFYYVFDTTTAVNPATGELRLNNINASAATQIYIDYLTHLGNDLHTLLPLVTEAGDTIYLQDQDDATKYQVYTLTADPVLNAGNTYITLPVSWDQGGGTPFAKNNVVIMLVGRQGGGGGDLTQDAADIRYVNIAGDTMSGSLTLKSSDPTGMWEAVPKDYADRWINLLNTLKVNKSGDVMTGALTLPGDPTLGLQAATKQYVDAQDARFVVGPYARWLFNDEVGTIAADSVGNRDGTYVGTPILSDEKVTFVGSTSQYVTLPIPEYGTFLPGSTIEFWINTTTTASGAVFGVANSVDQMVLQLMVNATATSGTSTNSDRSVFRIRNAPGTVNKHWSTYDIPYDGNWHHVLIDLSSEPISVDIYVDGSLASVTTSGSGNLNSLDLTTFQYPLHVGARNAQGTIDLPYSGSIKGLTLYPYSVDADQAQEMYTIASGLPPRWTRNWSWWTRPRAVAYNGKLFVMGSWGFDVGLDIYNINGERTPYRLTRFPEFEDHNNGAVIIRTGKPMVTIWTRHAKDSSVRFRVGNVNVENAETREDYLGTIQTTYIASDRTTYIVALDVGGTIWVFNRIDLPRWRIRKTTAWSTSGVTWGAEIPFVHSTDDKQMYTAAVNVGTTTVRAACSNHPVNGAGLQGVYYCEINTATDAVTSASGAALGTLGTEINHTALQPVYVPPAGWATWIYDVGDNPSIKEVVFVTFDLANRDTTGVYKYGRWNGSAWVVTDIATSGKRFSGVSGDTEPYFGSVHIPRGTPGGVCYLARESGGVWTIERRNSSDSGATWVPTVLRSLTEHPRQNFVRAFPVEGDGSYPAEVVHVQTFRWTTYDAYRSDFLLYPEPVPEDTSVLDALYVNVSGDVMTGILTLPRIDAGGGDLRVETGSAATDKFRVTNAGFDKFIVGGPSVDALMVGRLIRMELGNTAGAKFQVLNTGFEKFYVDKDGYMFVGNGALISGGTTNTAAQMRGLFSGDIEFWASRFDGTGPPGANKRGTLGVTGSEDMILSTESLSLGSGLISFRPKGREVLQISDGLGAVGVFRTTTITPVLDDQAFYIDFRNAAGAVVDSSRGIAVIQGSAAGAGHAVVAFRVGTAAHATILASGGIATTGGTGTLGGTTGADASFNIRADTSTSTCRLYFENRTGGQRGYTFTFLSMDGGMPQTPVLI